MEKPLLQKGAVFGGLIVAVGGILAALLSRGSSAPTITVSPVFHNDIQLTTASTPAQGQRTASFGSCNKVDSVDELTLR